MLCVKCLTKRDKVWVNELMLINVEDNSFFSLEAVHFTLPMHSFGFFKKKRWGKARGQEDKVPRFSVFIYLFIFIMALLLKLFGKTKSRVEHKLLDI